MNILSPVRRITSYVCLLAGIVMFVASLYMDIARVKNDARGTLLVAGALLIIAGLYFFPTLKHHRTIINILFPPVPPPPRWPSSASASSRHVPPPRWPSPPSARQCSPASAAAPPAQSNAVSSQNLWFQSLPLCKHVIPIAP